MKKIFIGSLAGLMLASVASADIQIGVGQEGRGYEAFGKQIVERLGARAPAETVNYEGSDDISRAVCDGAADLGIMQIDAIYARQAEGCKLRVVGTYGAEYAYLLVPGGSKLDELHDFNSSTRILVDTIGSGTDLFWHTIVGIEKGENGNKSTWADATPVNDPIFIAETMAEIGDIDAVLMVAVPGSAELKGLISSGWELIELVDKDINDQTFNGESLYPRATSEIEGTGGWFSGNSKAKSYVVRSFVVMGEALSSDRRAFADVARAVSSVSRP